MMTGVKGLGKGENRKERTYVRPPDIRSYGKSDADARDHESLHAGEVSDTQLALADMKARRFGHSKSSNARSGSLDCSPFCK
eukprot:753809-Hanusia_phi.AAC.4